MSQENQEERIERAIWAAVEALRGSMIEMREAFVVVISIVLLKFIVDVVADRASGTPGAEGGKLWESLKAPPRLSLMNLRGDEEFTLSRRLISAFEEWSD